MSSPLHSERPKIITVKSKFVKMSYKIQFTDIANQLAKYLYGAQSLDSILGKSQNVIVSRLRNITIKVVMPSLPLPPKPDKTCRVKKDNSGKKGKKISKHCMCSKCRSNYGRNKNEYIIGDEKSITVFRAIKSMICHGIKSGVNIVF